MASTVGQGVSQPGTSLKPSGSYLGARGRTLYPRPQKIGEVFAVRVPMIGKLCLLQRAVNNEPDELRFHIKLLSLEEWEPKAMSGLAPRMGNTSLVSKVVE